MAELKRIAVGCDHGGLEMKRDLAGFLREQGWEVVDVGCHEPVSVDYPTYAQEVARKVAAGEVPVGLLVCGTGIGMSIAANKVPGVRAAVCGDCYSAEMTRRHNDANVLCLGGRVVGPELARVILRTFLGAKFEGGRHQKRLDLIEKL